VHLTNVLALICEAMSRETLSIVGVIGSIGVIVEHGKIERSELGGRQMQSLDFRHRKIWEMAESYMNYP